MMITSDINNKQPFTVQTQQAHIKKHVAINDNETELSQDTIEISKTKEKKGLNKPVLALSTIGTLIPLIFIAKRHGANETKSLFKKILDVEYEGLQGLKDIASVSVGSILGGLSGGLLTSKKEDYKEKIKESLYQFLNIIVPLSATIGLGTLSSKLIEKLKNPTSLTKGSIKVGSIVAGIGIGMPIALGLTNKINDVIFNNKDKSQHRKIKPKDFVAQTDDVIAALSMMFKPLGILQKALPFIFVSCGYDAGAHSVPEKAS